MNMLDADPPDLHVLPGYENDDRTLDKWVHLLPATIVILTEFWLLSFNKHIICVLKTLSIAWCLTYMRDPDQVITASARGLAGTRPSAVTVQMYWVSIVERWFRISSDISVLFLSIFIDFKGITQNGCWGYVWLHSMLTHWGRATHICVSKLTIIGSDNGLSPGRRQAIIWTNAGILLIEALGTNFSEILIGIHIFSFKKMRLKMSSAKWRPFCLGLNVLMEIPPCYSDICRLINGVNITTEDEHMWLIPYTEGEPHTLKVTFNQPIHMAGLRFWNYNKSPEDTFRGVGSDVNS